MNKIVLMIVLFLMPFLAIAGEATATWDPPLQYEDGTTLPPEEIQSYKVYIATSTSGPFTLSATVPGTVNTVTITNLERGTYYFAATTVATNGLESIYSNIVSKTIVNNGKPKAPRNLR